MEAAACSHKKQSGDPHTACTACLRRWGVRICTVEERCQKCAHLNDFTFKQLIRQRQQCRQNNWKKKKRTSKASQLVSVKSKTVSPSDGHSDPNKLEDEEGCLARPAACGHYKRFGDPHTRCTACLRRWGLRICTVEERCSQCEHLDDSAFLILLQKRQKTPAKVSRRKNASGAGPILSPQLLRLTSLTAASSLGMASIEQNKDHNTSQNGMDNVTSNAASGIQPILIEPEDGDGAITAISSACSKDLCTQRSAPLEGVIADVPSKPPPGSVFQLVSLNVNGVVKTLKIPMMVSGASPVSVNFNSAPGRSSDSSVVTTSSVPMSVRSSVGLSTVQVIPRTAITVSRASLPASITTSPSNASTTVSPSTPREVASGDSGVAEPLTTGANAVARPNLLMNMKSGRILKVVRSGVGLQARPRLYVTTQRALAPVQTVRLAGSEASQQAENVTASTPDGTKSLVVEIAPPRKDQDTILVRNTVKPGIVPAIQMVNLQRETEGGTDREQVRETEEGTDMEQVPTSVIEIVPEVSHGMESVTSAPAEAVPSGVNTTLNSVFYRRQKSFQNSAVEQSRERLNRVLMTNLMNRTIDGGGLKKDNTRFRSVVGRVVNLSPPKTVHRKPLHIQPKPMPFPILIQQLQNTQKAQKVEFASNNETDEPSTELGLSIRSVFSLVPPTGVSSSPVVEKRNGLNLMMRQDQSPVSRSPSQPSLPKYNRSLLSPTGSPTNTVSSLCRRRYLEAMRAKEKFEQKMVSRASNMAAKIPSGDKCFSSSIHTASFPHASNEERQVLNSILLNLVNRHIKTKHAVQTSEVSPGSNNAKSDDIGEHLSEPGIAYESTGDDLLMELEPETNVVECDGKSVGQGTTDRSGDDVTQSLETGFAAEWKCAERETRTSNSVEASGRETSASAVDSGVKTKSSPICTENLKTVTDTNSLMALARRLSPVVVIEKLDLDNIRKTRSGKILKAHTGRVSPANLSKKLINTVISNVLDAKIEQESCHKNIDSETLVLETAEEKTGISKHNAMGSPKNVTQYAAHIGKESDGNLSDVNKTVVLSNEHQSDPKPGKNMSEKCTEPDKCSTQEIDNPEVVKGNDTLVDLTVDSKETTESAPSSLGIHGNEPQKLQGQSPDEKPVKTPDIAKSTDAANNIFDAVSKYRGTGLSDNREKLCVGPKTSARLQEKGQKIHHNGKYDCGKVNCFGCTALDSKWGSRTQQNVKSRKLKERRLLFKKFKEFYPGLMDCTIKVHKLNMYIKGKHLKGKTLKSVNLKKCFINGGRILTRCGSKEIVEKRKSIDTPPCPERTVQSGHSVQNQSKDKYLMIRTSRGTYLVPVDGDENKPAMFVTSEEPGPDQSSKASVRIIPNWRPNLAGDTHLLRSALVGAAVTMDAQRKQEIPSPNSGAGKSDNTSWSQKRPGLHSTIGEQTKRPRLENGQQHNEVFRPGGQVKITKKEENGDARLKSVMPPVNMFKKAACANRIKALKERLRLMNQRAADETKGVLEKSKDVLRELDEET